MSLMPTIDWPRLERLLYQISTDMRALAGAVQNCTDAMHALAEAFHEEDVDD